MAMRTDGTNESGHPNVRTFVQDAAIAALQGLLANPSTTGTDTQIGPSITFTAASLARQLEAELSKAAS